MPTLTLRNGLGRPLTYEEMDDNLLFVESKAQEASSSADAAGLSAQATEADRQAAQTAAGLAEDDAQSAAGSASTAQYWAEEAQSIVTDGVVDDSGPSSVTTYSSQHIETKLEGKAPSSHNHDGRYVRLSGAGVTVEDPGNGGLAIRTKDNDGDYIFQAKSSGSAPRFTVAHDVTELKGDSSGWKIGSDPVATETYVDQQIGNIGSQRLDLLTATYASTTASAGINTSASAVVRVDASANRTLSLTNPPENNRAQVVTVLLTGNTGMITWPSAIRWSGGTAPGLMPTWTAVTLMWAGDGYWYGFVSGGAD